MAFESIEAVVAAMTSRRAIRVLVKPLAENDNSKQQIYLSPGFEALNELPFGARLEVHAAKNPTFHAPVDLWWLSDTGQVEQATHAKLILYPDYPEVRLSGFLLGCRSAPSKQLQPVPKAKRKFNNGPDGRFLLLGITDDDKILAVLATAGSSLASALKASLAKGAAVSTGVLYELPVPGGTATALGELLVRLADIRKLNPHTGRKLSGGVVQPYCARNAGGFTLEALLGISANSRSEPDFKGWEIKTFGGDKITLLTTEPDGGVYAINGLETFLKRYGYPNKGRLNFTGAHKAQVVQSRTKLRLTLTGFDAKTSKITDVSGGLFLVDTHGNHAASWSFAGLMQHWGRKHSHAIYVPNVGLDCKYSYKSPALVGEGTTFELFLSALLDHKINYDPGSWLVENPREQKKRNQFRVTKRRMAALYKSMREEPF